MPFVIRTDSAFVHALGTVPRQLGCIEETLGAAGFADVAIDRVDIWLPGARSVREAADLLSLIGPLARLMRERGADEAMRLILVEDLTDRLAAYATADGVRLPAMLR